MMKLKIANKVLEEIQNYEMGYMDKDDLVSVIDDLYKSELNEIKKENKQYKEEYPKLFEMNEKHKKLLFKCEKENKQLREFVKHKKDCDSNFNRACTDCKNYERHINGDQSKCKLSKDCPLDCTCGLNELINPINKEVK